jgi:hypothetical protein
MQMVAPRAAFSAQRTHTRPAWLSWQHAAVTTTCAAVAFLPLLIPQGAGNISPVDAFILVAIAVTACWAQVERLRVRVPYVLPVAVLAFAGAIASLFSVYEGAGVLSVVQDIVLLAWCTALVNVCRTPEGMSAVLRTWAYAAAVWALLMIVGVFTGMSALSGVTAREGVRASITFGDPNMAAGYYCTSFMVLWASGRPRRRGVRWCAAAVILVAIALTGSNGFSLATGGAIFTAGIIGMARRKGVLPAVIAACVVVGCAGVVVSRVNIAAVVRDAAAGAPALRDYVGRFTQTTAVRQDLLQETLGLASRGGLVGIGPGAVKPTLEADQASVAFEAHSDYTASIVERGLLGGLGLLLLLLAIGWRARETLGPLRRDYAATVPHPGALVGALVAYAIAANIYELLHFRYVWALLALVAALAIWGRERAR